jgi:hypothetical protein
MVTPLSDGGGGLRGLLLLEAVLVSGLLVVTKFLVFSVAVLMDGFAFPGLAADGLCTTGLAAAALTTAAGLAAFLTGLAGTVFFSGSFFAGAFERTGLEAGFVAAFFAATVFTGFFATAGFAFATGLADALRAAPAAARATGFARAGAFAVFVRLPEFFLLFAIPKAYSCDSAVACYSLSPTPRQPPKTQYGRGLRARQSSLDVAADHFPAPVLQTVVEPAAGRTLPV